MSTRQYIGARYVPKFYQNSVDGSATWESNVVYEPLTWVTLTNGHIYLSRKQVPATVGTPSQNIDYWLDVGSYNGFIEGLQEQIDTINNVDIPALDGRLDVIEPKVETLEDTVADLDDVYIRLHNKKIIVLGDSIESGAGSAVGHTWVEQMATKYGCTVVNEGVSGSPISGTSDVDSYINRIDDILAANNSCDYFVIAGGANDKNRNHQPGSTSTTNENTLSGALKAIIKKVRVKYGKTCQIRTMTQLHRYDDYNTAGFCEFDYVQAMMRASAISAVPCFDRYSNLGFNLTDDSTANAWCDVGYVDSGVRNYHPSIDAYAYALPTLAEFIANGSATNPSQYPIYKSASGEYISKTSLDNGQVIVSYSKSATATFTDLGNHLAGMADIQIAIPKEVGLSWINSIVVNVFASGWNVAGTVKYLTPPDGSTNNFRFTVAGLATYGSTPPVSETVKVSAIITGY